ncbi:MAG TPA: bifunctional riboflavin kinase/FAD synthetase [Candidatus Kapabacteria bacterium]|nr:bifunctional riboflavin kinase/FAD synthetase [Candidatus Kapabacteria bacterium]
MQIIKDIKQIVRDENTIITLGTFDGVHLGHKQLINQMIDIANRDNLRKVLITIYPHPQNILKKPATSAIKLLNSIDERLHYLQQFDLDIIYLLEFNLEVASLTANQFIIDLIYANIGFKKIIIGYDHTFGKNREGTKEYLLKLASLYKFEVIQDNAFTKDDKILSSTLIRKLLLENQIEKVNEYLGYNYEITGKVVHGDNRGEKIGFPTANIEAEDQNKLLPANGVYFVSSVIDNVLYYGMANIGVRPTITDIGQVRLEVNYLNFNMQIYDKEITVRFHNFIRYEVKFSGLEALVAQLNSDKLACQKYIKQLDNNSF